MTQRGSAEATGGCPRALQQIEQSALLVHPRPRCIATARGSRRGLANRAAIVGAGQRAHQHHAERQRYDNRSESPPFITSNIAFVPPWLRAFRAGRGLLARTEPFPEAGLLRERLLSCGGRRHRWQHCCATSGATAHRSRRALSWAVRRAAERAGTPAARANAN